MLEQARRLENGGEIIRIEKPGTREKLREKPTLKFPTARSSNCPVEVGFKEFSVASRRFDSHGYSRHHCRDAKLAREELHQH